MIAILERDTTVAAVRRHVADAFRRQGIDTPELDARILIGHALGLDHAGLASAAGRVLTSEEMTAISALADRRLAHEPVARIVGVKEFWGLEFLVTPSTLVPRPETETVVETALKTLDAQGRRTCPLRIADLGTGSGALLLALLSELPNATGVGTDLNPAALQSAYNNARRLGLASRAQFALCDFAAALGGRFDIVVSNPPYIASGEIGSLAPEVRDNDPHLALDGGPDGLAAYRTIATDARRILARDGILVLELGPGQASAVAAGLLANGLESEPPTHDLSGHPRALLARQSMQEKHPQRQK